MRRQSRTKLVPPKTEPKNPVLEPIEESNLQEQKEEPMLTEETWKWSVRDATT